jgi:hypothetical protein
MSVCDDVVECDFDNEMEWKKGGVEGHFKGKAALAFQTNHITRAREKVELVHQRALRPVDTMCFLPDNKY